MKYDIQNTLHKLNKDINNKSIRYASNTTCNRFVLRFLISCYKVYERQNSCHENQC